MNRCEVVILHRNRYARVDATINGMIDEWREKTEK